MVKITRTERRYNVKNRQILLALSSIRLEDFPVNSFSQSLGTSLVWGFSVVLLQFYDGHKQDRCT